MKYKSNKLYWCYQCLNFAFKTQEKLNNHLKLCLNHESVATILPENKTNWNGDREDILKFKIMVTL